MWRQITVDEDEEFAICFNFENKQYQCTMFDKKNMTGYCVIISDEELMRRTKQLNRRINYPEDAVRKIILNEEPVDSILDAGESDGHFVLKLKYREAESQLPFHSEWNLTRMETPEVWTTILTPLLQTVNDLYGQVVDLNKCVRDKDAEIQQYKVEGAQLRRSTVATKPFDSSKFDALHKKTSMQIQGFQNFGAYLMQISKFCKPSENASTTMTTPPKLQTKVENSNENVLAKKESPRNRKRKANEFGKVHLERKVIQRRQAQQLLYKDSQSQSDSQDEELARKLAFADEDVDEDSKPSTSSVCVSTKPVTPSVQLTSKSNKAKETISKESNTKNMSSLADRKRKSTTPPAVINGNVENPLYDEQGLSASLIYETSTDESFTVESPKVCSSENIKQLKQQIKACLEKSTQNNENKISKLAEERKRKSMTSPAANNVSVENHLNKEQELSDSLVYETSTDESLTEESPKAKSRANSFVKGQVVSTNGQRQSKSDIPAIEEVDKQRRRQLYAHYDFANELHEIEQCMDELNEVRRAYDNL